MSDLRQQLTEILSGRTCVVGIGNAAQADDAVGLWLAQRLSADARLETPVLLAGTEPDRHLGELCRRDLDRVHFLDAVDFQAEPGAVVLLNSAEMRSRYPQISTHRLSLGLLAQCIESGSQTRVWLLGVQPESVQPGRDLSARVQATVDLLCKVLVDVLRAKRNEWATLCRQPRAMKEQAVL